MTLSHISYYGRPALQLSNECLSLIVVPEFSARVVSLIADNNEYLWRNEPLLKGETGGDPTFGNWMNWGGYKTWLAPQDSWPNPMGPSTEMDRAEWEIMKADVSTIELRGPAISWAGVRLGRRLSLAANILAVRVRETIENVSESPRTWAVWSVTQLPVPGWATYPSNADRRSLVPPAQTFNGDRLRFSSDAKWKMGAYVSEGWGSYKADAWNGAFKVVFSPHPQTEYPNKVNLETWSNTSPDYMELEWLGPSVTLWPNERWDWETEWRLE
jgi:hypothetical protein